EGQILPVNRQVLSPDTVRQTALALMSPEQREHFQREWELDFAISEPGLGRFRVNVFMQRGCPAMVLRYITADMPRLDSLGLREIRDRESMEAGIALAGTGHLVLATLHANNCAESLDRIINMFPREQHNQIFLDLSQYLRGVMAQRLVMGKEGRRVAAVEIMLNTPYIATLIKKGDVVSIKEAIHKSAERGIQSFDEALYTLFKSGKVELEEALTYADSRANLEAKVNFG